MAEPFDGAFELDDITEIVQTQYFQDYLLQYPQRFGGITASYFAPASEVGVGSGLTVQFEIYATDAARWQTNPNGASASPASFAANTLGLRWSQNGANDWSTVTAAARATLADIRNAGKGAITDLVNRVYNEAGRDYEEKLAIHRHLPKSGLMGTVTATPVQNNKDLFANCTASATNTTGCRFKITGCSNAWIRAGTHIDVVRSGVVIAGNLVCTDPQSIDSSFGFAFTSSLTPSGNTSTGNIANIAAADEIYIAGEYNAGMYSMGAFFSNPATGDSFIGGVDRNASGYRWLVPTMTNRGATAVAMTRNQFDTLALAMNFKGESEMSAAWTSPPDIHRKIRQELGENAFFQMSTDDDRMKRFMKFGTTGLNYQDPVFGCVKIIADPLHTPNCVRFIAADTWKTYYYGKAGFNPVRSGGDVGAHWMRLPESTPNTGFGTAFQADWRAWQLDMCMMPWKNGAILNVTA